MTEHASLFIVHEEEDGTSSTVIQISVDSDSDEQSRAEILASIIAIYSRPLMHLDKQGLIDIQAAIVRKQH